MMKDLYEKSVIRIQSKLALQNRKLFRISIIKNQKGEVMGSARMSSSTV